MQPKKPLIEARGLTKKYEVRAGAGFGKREIRAVDSLDLKIYPGEVFGLVGESGCGKTTAGHLLAGLLPPSGGEVAYAGASTCGMRAAELRRMRREVQVVFQDPYAALNPKKTVGWMVEEPLKIHFQYGRAARCRKVVETLASVGLDESFLSRYPGELSGGQRQRVSIAAALMLEAKMLVTDEAVSALDVSIQAQILNLLKDLQRDRNLTYLFISHDLNVVQYMSDRIGVMYLGRLVECGGVEDVYTDPRHPYTRALLSSILLPAEERGPRISLTGEVPSLLSLPTGCAFHPRCPHMRENCLKERPGLRELSPGHFAACLHADW